MKRSTLAIVLAGQLVTLLLLCGAVSAQTIKVNGLITGRNGATMTLQTAWSGCSGTRESPAHSDSAS